MESQRVLNLLHNALTDAVETWEFTITRILALYHDAYPVSDIPLLKNAYQDIKIAIQDIKIASQDIKIADQDMKIAVLEDFVTEFKSKKKEITGR